MQSDISVYSEAKANCSRKRSFQRPFMFVVKKRFFDERCGLNFFPAKIVPVELNLKHRSLTKVVEQTLNMSTWSDRSKTLPSTCTSCLLGI